MKLFVTLMLISLVQFSFAEETTTSKNIIATDCDTSKIELEIGDYIKFYYPPLSIEQVEARQLTTIEVDGVTKTVPFGFINDSWKKLKEMHDNDSCILFFKSSEESWKHLYGIKGYMLIKKRESIYTIITSRS